MDLTPEEQDPKKKKYIKKVTPLEDWITEQLASQVTPDPDPDGGGD